MNGGITPSSASTSNHFLAKIVERTLEMTRKIYALNGQYESPKILRFARNQVEAGISHLPWEGRLQPLRPISRDIAVALSFVSTMAAACFLV
jgi:hypothetical protein